MTESDTIEIGVDKTTENYAVYESADGDTIVGMYVSQGAADAVGEFATLTISEDADVTATVDKQTTNYVVYSTEDGAVSGMYVSRDLLQETFDLDEDEDGDTIFPESIGLTLAESDEEAFEADDGPVADPEEEAALVEGSVDTGESESESESEDEEVEISDEEVGLVDE